MPFISCPNGGTPPEFTDKFCQIPTVTDCLGRDVVNIYAKGENDMRFNPFHTDFDQIDSWGIKHILWNIEEGIRKNTESGDGKRLEKWQYAKNLVNQILRDDLSV